MNENVYISEDVPLVEFMYLVFTRMPGESYRRRLSSLLLYLCDVFQALINSLVFFILFLYTVHNLSHKTLLVHSARYRQCTHVGFHKLKLLNDIHTNLADFHRVVSTCSPPTSLWLPLSNKQHPGPTSTH